MSEMLYKGNGKHLLHNVKVDYITVNEDEVEGKLEEGWFKTPIEADEALIVDTDVIDDPIIEPDANKAPTREEMETKAKELRITFPSNIKDSTLLSKINAKIAENEG